MKIRILVPLACLVASSLAGCDSASEKAAMEPVPSAASAVTSANTAVTPAAAEAAVQSAESMRFVLEDSGTQQSLQLGKRADGGFDVALAVTGACSRTETGTAVADGATGDPDIRTDPEGEGHPVEAFELSAQGDCKVLIQLDSLEQGYAWLKEKDCNSACPLSGDAMTRK